MLVNLLNCIEISPNFPVYKFCGNLRETIPRKSAETMHFHKISTLGNSHSQVGDLEAVAQRCSVKKVFLEISQNSEENTCARVPFLIKSQAETCNFIQKETLAQVFSSEFCEISKNTFSYRTPPVAASRDS